MRDALPPGECRALQCVLGGGVGAGLCSLPAVPAVIIALPGITGMERARAGFTRWPTALAPAAGFEIEAARAKRWKGGEPTRRSAACQTHSGRRCEPQRAAQAFVSHEAGWHTPLLFGAEIADGDGTR